MTSEIRHSGVVPTLIVDGVRKYVLITNRNDVWGLPKGVIEPSMEPWESAAKEALEEAGVVGTVEPAPHTDYQHHKERAVTPVRMYLQHVTKVLNDWDEDHLRGRAIVSYGAALELIRPEVAPVLKWADHLLSK